MSEFTTIENIDIPASHRGIDEPTVIALMKSIGEIGLQQPIHVWLSDDFEQLLLVAGRHRLEAGRRLGWDRIPCVFVHTDETQRALWEIDENLCRAELSPAERIEHTTRRAELISDKLSDNTETKQKRGRPGVAAKIARETGRHERAVQRDLRRGKQISEEVMALVQGTVLDTEGELDALGKLPKADQSELADAALRGQDVSARERLEARRRGDVKLYPNFRDAPDGPSETQIRNRIEKLATEMQCMTEELNKWEPHTRSIDSEYHREIFDGHGQNLILAIERWRNNWKGDDIIDITPDLAS